MIFSQVSHLSWGPGKVVKCGLCSRKNTDCPFKKEQPTDNGCCSDFKKRDGL